MNNYFPHNYFGEWFPKHYFILNIVVPTKIKGGGGGGGSYIQPQDQYLFPFPIDVEPTIADILKQDVKKKLPEVVEKLKEIIDEDEEAVILIQIISELPHALLENKQFTIKDNKDIIEMINFVNKI